jgi:hypothetical protein
MSKIVQAVNAMISNKRNISNVMAGANGEIFFLYKDKYKWSMRADDSGDYMLWHYPNDGWSLESLAQYDQGNWEEVPMVFYRASDIGTKEARASFAELYQIIKDRQYGMDEVLDDIISDSELF